MSLDEVLHRARALATANQWVWSPEEIVVSPAARHRPHTDDDDASSLSPSSPSSSSIDNDGRFLLALADAFQQRGDAQPAVRRLRQMSQQNCTRTPTHEIGINTT